MTERRYPRSLIEPLLVRTPVPESYRIMPRRHVGSPLGTTPYDRSVVKLKAGDVGQLEERVELPGVLERHAIGLVL